ncbi:hypothetical protein [Carnobacterium alterfunditum]|uniref:hypothetical protein n=1 Tax=Carnobacterium alterfunditum TaxID=28230 RepID=UPI003593A446
MNKNYDVIKKGILVTIGSFITLAAAFILYFLIFMVFEKGANQGSSYNFVAPLRVGYGIIWLILCLIIYRTKIRDWLKASMLTGSLTTFMIGTGVQLFENPIIVGLIMFAVVATGVFLLHRMKKQWYHYYSIVISMIATLFYL